ncbi:MAG: hypothetical protein JXR88_02930 [Clostridia bacterium]|nr:hypothetical protein [Clostridia bacterium]
MKKQTIFSILLGVLGFFALDMIGVHNLFTKVIILVAVIVIGYIILEKRKKEE